MPADPLRDLASAFIALLGLAISATGVALLRPRRGVISERKDLRLIDPAGQQLGVLPKTLVIDLSSLQGMPGKIEGVAVTSPDRIAVANDNDFDIPGTSTKKETTREEA